VTAQTRIDDDANALDGFPDSRYAHRAYAQVIEERIAAAKAVVVDWSADAVKSQWVFSEANRAREDAGPLDQRDTAFGIQPGDKMYLAPVQRVTIW
jgi:predicted metalloendopeptidase